MQPQLLLVTLLSASLAAAVNICAYGSKGCGGSWVCCNNLAAYRCCYWNSPSMGWALAYRNTSQTWWAGGYEGQNCGSVAMSTFGTEDMCQNVPATPGHPACGSGSWNPVEACRAGGPVQKKPLPAEPCQLPDTMGFTWSDRKYEVKIREGEYDAMIKLLEAGDYSALRTRAYEVQS